MKIPGFDDKIISMYARGMSAREITGHLRELYRSDRSKKPDCPTIFAFAHYRDKRIRSAPRTQGLFGGANFLKVV